MRKHPLTRLAGRLKKSRAAQGSRDACVSRDWNVSADLQHSRGGDGSGESREDGRIMLLSIGYMLIAIMILTVVLAVTTVYLEHKKLLDLADRASSAAADSFAAQDVGERGGLFLGDAAVRQAAEEYLYEVNAPAEFSEFGILATTGAPDATTARVSLRAVVHPPIVNLIVPAGFEIEVESDSRITLSR